MLQCILMLCSLSTFSQIGINTVNPQHVFHIDAAMNNDLNPSDPNTSLDDIVFTSQGYVGIGTTNPTEKFDIVGNTQISHGSMFGYQLSNAFTYDDRRMSHYALRWGSDSYTTLGPTLWQSAFGGMKFFTGGLLRVILDYDGNIGVGRDDPRYKFDVEGTMRGKHIVVQDSGRITRAFENNFIYKNHTIGHYSVQWVADDWKPAGPSLYLTGWGGMKLFTGGEYQVGINSEGNVGIGTENPMYKLDVAGVIRATNVKIEALPWADFVFDDNYILPSLNDVKAYVKEYKHLPDIPSEQEVKENGIDIGDMQVKLLRKIEELTLYVIQQNQKIEEQEKRILELEK